MSGLALVYTVFPDEASARAAILSAVTDGLAACANLMPAATSFYEWDGALQENSEFPVVLKTTAARVDALIERISAMHPYEAPAILSWPIVRAPAPFVKWVNQATRH
jgi:periplasmic divalent cation tolerance protein